MAALLPANGRRSTSDPTPPRPTGARGSSRAGEAERGSAPEAWTTPSTSATRVAAIMIDTVNRDGTSQARINPAQLELARAQLAAGRPLGRRLLPQPARRPRSGAAILDADPHVVAVDRRQHATRTASPAAAAYWLISTSSLADFPQQARMFRLRETPAAASRWRPGWSTTTARASRASRASSPTSTPRAGARSISRAPRADRNARLFVR